MILYLLACSELNFENELANDNDGDGYSIFDGDCNDADQNISPEDKDGDGLSSCDGDCDDTNPELNQNDRDGDLITSCEGDCKDDDPLFQKDNCPTFILIDSGSFMMGSPPAEIGRGDDETLHQVTLTHDFELMSTEVTQSLYLILTGENPSEFADCGERCPVDSVNWNAAAATANALSEMEGYENCYDCSVSSSTTCRPIKNPYECKGYRLPTEAEWEYAARFGSNKSFWTSSGGGDLPAFASTDTNADLEEQSSSNVCDSTAMVLSDAAETRLSSLAWFCANNQDPVNNQSGYGSKEVGTLIPNGYGLYDMHGNLYEWIHDGYGPYETNDTDPIGMEETEGGDWNNQRIMRGGFWGEHPKNLRSANRVQQSSTITYKYTGFRLARTAN